MAEEQPSGLFAIFLLTIYSLVLIPYTLYRVCSSGEEKAEAVVKGKKKQSGWQQAASKLLTKGNITLLLAWALWVAIIFYVQSSSGDIKPFDPFEILGVERGATDKEIKKAYRKLSLVYHPDKNPDPKAAEYFASFISKAYKALTDEVSRQNYEKYGHPDGPQGMNIGVALPSWMFSKDRKTAPLMLLALVGGGILLPLAVVSYYMLKGDPYTGPNRIHQNTIMMYLSPKWGVKESQSLVRIPETMMNAMEFVLLYTPNDHTEPLDDVRKMVAPYYQDVMGRDKKAFWQRKASAVKAHMLLFAHLERMGDDVPAILQADLKFVRQKCPVLLEEMVKIAGLPRNNLGYGWMTPALASVEMMQCIAQALPVSSRKASGGKGSDTLGPLLALPHFDQDVVKKLRKQRVNAVKDLQALSDSDLTAALFAAGVTGDAADDVAAALAAIPRLAAAATFEVDGEDEICERDPVHCKVRILLNRPCHAQEGFSLKGTAVRAFTPSNPEPQDEAWYAFLTDPGSNFVLTWAKANLIEAERDSLEHPEAFAALAAQGASTDATAAAAGAKALAAPAAAPAASGGAAASSGGSKPDDGAVVPAGDGKKKKKRDEDEPPGQVLDLVFLAPDAGRHDLVLHIMSSTWVGADLAMPLKLKVAPLTRAAAEGREAKAAGESNKRFDSDSDDEDRGSAASGSEGDGSGEASDDEGSDYDSEETGELESSDEEDDAAADSKKDK